MLTRRFALQAIAAASALLAVGANEASAAFGGDARLPDAAVALLRDRTAACAVGKAYLASVPGLTRAQLLADIEAAQIAPAAGGGAAADRLNQAVRADFANGHTVLVHGWVLSRTEAAVCALAYLRAV